MCTLHGTHYTQCAVQGHFIVQHITHCPLINKATWTCPGGNSYNVKTSERVCPKCERSLGDSARNLFHKMEFYGEQNYTPTPFTTGASTPSEQNESNGQVSESEDGRCDSGIGSEGGSTPDAMDCD